MALERIFMWINEEEGFIAFDVVENKRHVYFEYLKFSAPETEKKEGEMLSPSSNIQENRVSL